MTLDLTKVLMPLSIQVHHKSIHHTEVAPTAQRWHNSYIVHRMNSINMDGTHLISDFTRKSTNYDRHVTVRNDTTEDIHHFRNVTTRHDVNRQRWTQKSVLRCPRVTLRPPYNSFRNRQRHTKHTGYNNTTPGLKCPCNDLHYTHNNKNTPCRLRQLCDVN